MQFTLKIKSDNEGMTDMPEYAVAALLRQTAERLENGYDSGKLRDVNGHEVGSWKLGTR